MTRSMTAYSRAASSEIKGLSWAIELHTVNRKVLDIHMHLPRELLFLDLDFRKMVSKALQRGQVTVRISYKRGKEGKGRLSLLKKLKNQWMKIAKELGFSQEEINLNFLLQQIDRVSIEELGPTIQAELKKTLQNTLDALVKMKEVEGKALETDILKRLKTLNTHLQEIETSGKNSAEKYRKKLQTRLKDLLKEASHDERLLREVALFAEKADITEEITRLKSHFAQVKELFKSKEKSIGRTLEFLTQEILREINTIGSKSQELMITKLVVASKAELEKIREQVQNIE